MPNDKVRTPQQGAKLLDSIGRGVVSPMLHDPACRHDMGLPSDEDERGPYMVELNVQYHGGLGEAEKKFLELWASVFGEPRAESRKKAAKRGARAGRQVRRTKRGAKSAPALRDEGSSPAA